MAVLKIERGPGAGDTFFIGQETTLGRDASQVTIHIADSKVSSVHARITQDKGHYYLRDKNSKNKTYLNGRPIDKKMRLEPGDHINIGCTWLYFGEEQETERIAKELKSYDVIQEVGEVEGIGRCFKVQQKGLDRIVTLHLLPTNIIKANPHLKKRFRQQARSLAKLNHENISIMLDFEAKESFLYLTTEYIDGESLFQLLKRESDLSLERAIEIGMGMAHGLAHAHSQGVVHQDINPGNITISGLRVILGGFGVGSVLADVNNKHSRLVGKIEYLSPEQIAGRDIDYRSDVYSFGIVLYELLAGRTPFEGTNEEVSEAHLDEPPPALPDFNPDIPAEVEKLVYQCLEKDSGNRPQDVQWIATTLENILLKHKAEHLGESPDVYNSLWLFYFMKVLHHPIGTWLLLPLIAIVFACLISLTK